MLKRRPDRVSFSKKEAVLKLARRTELLIFDGVTKR